jgi:hypothetical protein
MRVQNANHAGDCARKTEPHAESLYSKWKKKEGGIPERKNKKVQKGAKLRSGTY